MIGKGSEKNMAKISKILDENAVLYLKFKYMGVETDWVMTNGLPLSSEELYGLAVKGRNATLRSPITSEIGDSNVYIIGIKITTDKYEIEM